MSKSPCFYSLKEVKRKVLLIPSFHPNLLIKLNQDQIFLAWVAFSPHSATSQLSLSSAKSWRTVFIPYESQKKEATVLCRGGQISHLVSSTSLSFQSTYCNLQLLKGKLKENERSFKNSQTCKIFPSLSLPTVLRLQVSVKHFLFSTSFL